MNVVDLGHIYLLDALDGGVAQQLTFVKRNEPPEKYPGNRDAFSGTTTQEVLRALIDRALYVNQQIPCPETSAVIQLLRTSIYLLESRAKRVHGETLDVALDGIEREGTCTKCGHIRCYRHLMG